ncbi:hypothetical protein AMC82_CH01021 [Rhizobium phaseoli]|nr:hypothetical protein [Rhizobium phaseoli]ANL64716.1 hypothetical protein AMC84_CH01024 [Rhizobium phaseoli]ANL71077.1 hypothetical protein AMC83_CH01052 [Rhizobium phaseoli]ANL77530.1 hypothetical protein AMC82_CH01021 [Rhizobium phaseoli]MDH6650323.1 hypothetical protein [Rhizobium esperanzae]
MTGKMPEYGASGSIQQEDAIDEIVRRQTREATDDPNTDIDADTVFERVERLHAERIKAEETGLAHACDARL